MRRGGGAAEWVWKGGKGKTASIYLLIANPKGPQPLRHVFSFRADEQGFALRDERIENKEALPREPRPYFFYQFQQGQPVINIRGATRERRLARETLNKELSIFAQRRDPEEYPELAYLADFYKKIRIYREWTFGRNNTDFREPQKADVRNGRLEEDFSNLGLFLNRLQKTPKAKTAILDGLKDLYEGVTDSQSSSKAVPSRCFSSRAISPFLPHDCRTVHSAIFACLLFFSIHNSSSPRIRTSWSMR